MAFSGYMLWDCLDQLTPTTITLQSQLGEATGESGVVVIGWGTIFMTLFICIFMCYAYKGLRDFMLEKQLKREARVRREQRAAERLSGTTTTANPTAGGQTAFREHFNANPTAVLSAVSVVSAVPAAAPLLITVGAVVKGTNVPTLATMATATAMPTATDGSLPAPATGRMEAYVPADPAPPPAASSGPGSGGGGGGFSSFEAEDTAIGRRMQSEHGTAPTFAAQAEPAVGGGLARAVSERPAATPMMGHMGDDVEDVPAAAGGRHLEAPDAGGAGRPRQHTEPGLAVRSHAMLRVCQPALVGSFLTDGVCLQPPMPVDAPVGLPRATSEGSRRPHTMAAMEEGEDDL